MGANCKSCRFLDVAKTYWSEGGKKSLRPPDQWERRCRRFPPTLIKFRSSCASWLAAGWPEVTEGDWCGEYQSKIRAIAKVEG